MEQVRLNRREAPKRKEQFSFRRSTLNAHELDEKHQEQREVGGVMRKNESRNEEEAEHTL